MHMTEPYGSWSSAQTLHDAALALARQALAVLTAGFLLKGLRMPAQLG